MIDTDKYEGHTPAPWRTGFAGVYCYDKDPDSKMVKITRTICKQPLHFDNENGDWVAYDGHTPANIAKIHPDQLLIADAPLLLAEVKWLRSFIEMVSYDLEWYPENFDQNKRKLEFNIRMWKGMEENEELW